VSSFTDLGTKCKIDNGDYKIVIAFNEVGEEVILQLPKAYKGIVCV
jgi:hypothetical protein